jgi:hypothetical protein
MTSKSYLRDAPEVVVLLSDKEGYRETQARLPVWRIYCSPRKRDFCLCDQSQDLFIVLLRVQGWKKPPFHLSPATQHSR